MSAIRHIKWPDIEQFRNVIRNVKQHAQYAGRDANDDPVYDPLRPVPTLDFEGTVKLHGTNAAVCYNRSTDEVWYQSRERIISIQDDNAGFCRFWQGLIESGINPGLLLAEFGGTEIVIFGEWCGGSIQKGVALNKLPKQFVIFGLMIDEVYHDFAELEDVLVRISAANHNLYHIKQIPTYKISIDFNKPELAQNEMIDITLKVEQECPWGQRFCATGTGEGVVWRCISPGYESSKFWFKVKGEKHSVSKVKTLAAVDTEKVASINEFVDKVVTPQRCQQSIDKLREAGHKDITRALLGDYIRWIVNDVAKEESDTAKASGIELKDVNGKLSQKAKEWFFQNETSL